MSTERVVLTRAQVNAMMPDGERVHTFMQASGPGFVLLGADWDRAEILALADAGKVELAGETATRMKHGMVAFDANHQVFVATKPDAVSPEPCPSGS